MNWIKRIFGKEESKRDAIKPIIKVNLIGNNLNDKYPTNSRKGFYVEMDACIACGAPQPEAPELIDHTKEDGDCYFKKQPETEEELVKAIKAMWVSCINGLRYGGNDEAIIKRLYQVGLGDLCDVKPREHYKLLVRNTTNFRWQKDFFSVRNWILDKFTKSKYNNFHNKVLDVEEGLNTYRFTHRWFENQGKAGIIYLLKHISDDEYELQLLPEMNTAPDTIIWWADSLNDGMISNTAISDIRWYEIGNNKSIAYKLPI